MSANMAGLDARMLGRAVSKNRRESINATASESGSSLRSGSVCARDLFGTANVSPVAFKSKRSSVTADKTREFIYLPLGENLKLTDESACPNGLLVKRQTGVTIKMSDGG
jgi:hypothetical protein